MPLIIKKPRKNEEKERKEIRAEMRLKQWPNKKSGKNKAQHVIKEKRTGILIKDSSYKLFCDHSIFYHHMIEQNDAAHRAHNRNSTKCNARVMPS